MGLRKDIAVQIVQGGKAGWQTYCIWPYLNNEWLEDAKVLAKGLTKTWHNTRVVIRDDTEEVVAEEYYGANTWQVGMR